MTYTHHACITPARCHFKWHCHSPCPGPVNVAQSSPQSHSLRPLHLKCRAILICHSSAVHQMPLDFPSSPSHLTFPAHLHKPVPSFQIIQTVLSFVPPYLNAFWVLCLSSIYLLRRTWPFYSILLINIDHISFTFVNMLSSDILSCS